jgi:hypothetical protein
MGPDFLNKRRYWTLLAVTITLIIGVFGRYKWRYSSKEPNGTYGTYESLRTHRGPSCRAFQQFNKFVHSGANYNEATESILFPGNKKGRFLHFCV